MLFTRVMHILSSEFGKSACKKDERRCVYSNIHSTRTRASVHLSVTHTEPVCLIYNTECIYHSVLGNLILPMKFERTQLSVQRNEDVFESVRHVLQLYETPLLS
jgi:hypothetical protein